MPRDLPASEAPMRLMIVTDAWHPQVNGVVRTLSMVVEELRRRGDVVELVGPERFPSLALPGDASIRLALRPRRRLEQLLRDFQPDAVHIATEGPLGWAMRGLCREHGWHFTSAFHTRFPDYLQARFGIPAALSWPALRRFHAAASATLVATPSLMRELEDQGFDHLRLWSRGVDTRLFHPEARDGFPDLPRPIFLQAGRLAAEKNVEAFLALDLPGSKVVVGDGPIRAALQRRFPQAHFTGFLHGAALAEAYASADVLVFPSQSDTFGLVLLEAMACGTPVAAYPQPGPRLVLEGAPGRVGSVSPDLRLACLEALTADRRACRLQAERFSWAACTAQMRASLVPLAA